MWNPDIWTHREELVLLPLTRDDERGLLVTLRKVCAPLELDVIECGKELEWSKSQHRTRGAAREGERATESLM